VERAAAGDRRSPPRLIVNFVPPKNRGSNADAAAAPSGSKNVRKEAHQDGGGWLCAKKAKIFNHVPIATEAFGKAEEAATGNDRDFWKPFATSSDSLKSTNAALVIDEEYGAAVDDIIRNIKQEPTQP